MDLLRDEDVVRMGHFARHGDVDRVVEIVTALAKEFILDSKARPGRPAVLDGFKREALVPLMIRRIEIVRV